MSRLLIALVVVALARPDALLGQASVRAASISPGVRVRITQPGEKARVAVMVMPGADTVRVRWLGSERPVAVPVAEISRLEISNGRHRPVLKGALLGALGVGTAGAVLGAASYSPCKSTEFFGCLGASASASESAVVGGVLGGALGLVVGTLAGLPSHESWRRVSLADRRVAVAVTPRGRATNLGVALRF